MEAVIAPPLAVVARLDRAIQYTQVGDYWITRSSRVTTSVAMKRQYATSSARSDD